MTESSSHMREIPEATMEHLTISRVSSEPAESTDHSVAGPIAEPKAHTADNPGMFSADVHAASSTFVPRRATQDRRERQQSISLVLLAVLAVIYTIYLTRAVLQPILMSIILALLFRPVVRRACSYRIPAAATSAAVMCSLLFAVVIGAAYIVGPAQEWIDSAPTNFKAVGEKLRVFQTHIRQISQATLKVEEIANGKRDGGRPATTPFPFDSNVPAKSGDTTSPAGDDPKRDLITADQSTLERDKADASSAMPVEQNTNQMPAEIPIADRPVPVEIRQPRLLTGLNVLSSTGTLLGEIFITFVLAYFLLSSGDVLVNNVLRILPSFREKRNVVELVHNVERGISSYLFTVTCINVGVGVAIGLAMWLLGMPNPVLWGVMAVALNYIPYLGALVGISVVFLVGVLSFDSLSYACLAPAVYAGVTAIEGNFITPSLLGRSMSLNPIMVFLSLTLWGWMWGIGGAVLAVPILATLKVGFDQFERTRSIGTLLGGYPPPAA